MPTGRFDVQYPAHSRDDASEANFLELQRRLSGIAVGQSPAFTWSGANQTTVVVSHGLAGVPSVVIPSSARYGDAIGGDARAPWGVVAGAYTATTFTLVFRTHNNAVIGVFAVAAGACDWIAIL